MMDVKNNAEKSSTTKTKVGQHISSGFSMSLQYHHLKT